MAVVGAKNQQQQKILICIVKKGKPQKSMTLGKVLLFV